MNVAEDQLRPGEATTAQLEWKRGGLAITKAGEARLCTKKRSAFINRYRGSRKIMGGGGYEARPLGPRKSARRNAKGTPAVKEGKAQCVYSG